jgi:WD40 repeat protein
VARLAGTHKSVAFGAGGARLYTSGSAGVCSWDMDGLPAGGPAPNITMHDDNVIAGGTWMECALTSDGRLLASATGYGQDVEKRKVEVFSLPSRQSLPWTSPGIGSLVFDPSGRWLAASWWRGRGFTVWETATWKPVATRETDVASLVLAASADGRYLASCYSSELCLWETGEWKPALRVAFDPIAASPRQVAIAPHGDLVAFESEPYRIRLIRPDTGATIATLTLPLRDQIHHLAFSPDGNALAVSTAARTWFFDLPKMREHLHRLGLDFGP